VTLGGPTVAAPVVDVAARLAASATTATAVPAEEPVSSVRWAG